MNKIDLNLYITVLCLLAQCYVVIDWFKVVFIQKKMPLKVRLLEKYRGKGSNLHAQCAPDPKSGVSTNSTTAAYNKITKKGRYYLPLLLKTKNI